SVRPAIRSRGSGARGRSIGPRRPTPSALPWAPGWWPGLPVAPAVKAARRRRGRRGAGRREFSGSCPGVRVASRNLGAKTYVFCQGVQVQGHAVLASFMHNTSRRTGRSPAPCVPAYSPYLGVPTTAWQVLRVEVTARLPRSWAGAPISFRGTRRADVAASHTPFVSLRPPPKGRSLPHGRVASHPHRR